MTLNKQYRNKIIVFTAISLLLAGLFVYVLLVNSGNNGDATYGVVINEVCTNNNAIFIDAEGKGCDYIELYNSSDRSIDISNWYLSDDEKTLAKTKISGKVLEPKEFYVIYLNGETNFGTVYLATGPLVYASQGESVEFSLKSSISQRVTLCDSDGELIDEVIVPPLPEDMCYLRESDGRSKWVVKGPSPLESNSNSAASDDPMPPVVEVELSDERYTVNLTMRNSDLFDYETGIYTEGITWDRYLALPEDERETTGFVETDMIYHSNWKMGWKRKARIQIYDIEGNLIEDKMVHVSCHGNTSIVDDSKSLNVYVDDEPFKLFADNESQTAIVLRNGGSERFQTKFRDPVLQAQAKGLNVSVQDHIFADVYLNGTYLGPYAIMEKYNKDYFEKHYGVDKETVAILKNPIGQALGYPVDGTLSDQADFVALRDYARTNDLSDPECYDYVADRLDIDSFIDYIAIQSYIANVDAYPNNNIFVWRSKNDDGNPYSDGKWRFMLQDLDASAGADISYGSYTPDENRMKIVIDQTIDSFTTNLFSIDESKEEASFVTDPLLRGLMRNPQFKAALRDKIIQIAFDNYSTATMERVGDEAYDEIKSGWTEISGQKKSLLKEHRQDFFDFFDGRLDYVLKYYDLDFGGVEE